MSRATADGFLWSAFFIAIGVLIIVNLPPSPASTGAWFLLGSASIALGVGALIYELFVKGPRRGR